MMKRAAVLLLALFVLPSAARGAAIPAGTLVAGIDSQPLTLDPHASGAAITYLIASLNVTESLLYQDPDGRFRPWLARGYSVSPDGKTFTFSLRPDAAFSDGAPVNAEAVKWNFDRIVSPGFKPGAAATAMVSYAGATVVDDHTVRLAFKEPFAPFLPYVAGGFLALVSPKSTATQGPDVNRRPVGSGPFAFSEWVSQDHITMVRNAGYARRAPWSDHQGPARLERVVWRIIPESNARSVTVETGETQMIYLYSSPGSALAQLKGSKGLHIETTRFPGTSYLWWLNTRLAPTDDLQVRRALSYAVNRAAIVGSVYRGLDEVGCGLLSQFLLADTAACGSYPYNPAKAGELLDGAGWKMGPNNMRVKDGKPLTVVINSLSYGGGNFPEVELVQGQLLGIGIDARIKTQAAAPWTEDNYRCATNMGNIFLRTNDPDALYSLFHSSTIGGNFNWSCYANKDVDALLQEGRVQVDPAKRRAVYLKLQHLLLNQAVAIPLMDKLSVWAVRDEVRNVRYNYSTYPALSDASLQR